MLFACEYSKMYAESYEMEVRVLRKLPTGISNYEELVRDNCIYVDKTMYIEKLENLSDKRVMFLRPRKFGKTLFTSTIENYYDIAKKDKFEELFSKTYIGKNPTKNKNSYYILRFNFSGIDTTDVEATIKGFKKEIASSIEVFVNKYDMDFYINNDDEAENILDNLFKAFYIQKTNEKIYVIIDEYDHALHISSVIGKASTAEEFANELLGFHTNEFKNIVSKNGKVRKWYEILKKGTETVVERIFITGVAPITLDSTTSGFNIARDLTKDINFNDMLGFCKEDVECLMNELGIDEEKQKELMPIIKENYDGYIFSDMIEDNLETYKMYNSNMTLFFLNSFIEQNKIPNKLIDTNVISNYRKIEGFMNLCKSKGKINLLEKIVAGEYIECELTEKFNSEVNFDEKELISLLYYLGYLTIKSNDLGIIEFGSPNEVIRKIYTEYFYEYLKEITGIEELKVGEMTRHILLEGKIDKVIEILGKYLSNLSNRDYMRFEEKYVKVIFYAICSMLESLIVKSELEVGGGFADILLIPREKINERYGILIEFKYIKQEEYEKDNSLLNKKQEEAKAQLEKYKNTDEIKLIPKLKAYSVVAIKYKLIVEEV